MLKGLKGRQTAPFTSVGFIISTPINAPAVREVIEVRESTRVVLGGSLTSTDVLYYKLYDDIYIYIYIYIYIINTITIIVIIVIMMMIVIRLPIGRPRRPSAAEPVARCRQLTGRRRE